MTNVAAKVRLEKDAHPERFCPKVGCLWRVVTFQGPNPCRKHPAVQRTYQGQPCAYEKHGPAMRIQKGLSVRMPHQANHIQTGKRVPMPVDPYAVEAK